MLVIITGNYFCEDFALFYIYNTCHKGYFKTVYNRNGYNYFWSVDNSREVLDKLNNVNKPSSIHTYDFSTLSLVGESGW